MTKPESQPQVDHTVEIAKSALIKMAETGIPTDPLNFTVWYSYHVGDKPELNRTLDLLLNHGVPFTEQLNEEVYSKYFAEDQHSQAVRETSRRIQEAVNEVLEHVQTAGADYDTYTRKLAAFSDKLGDNESAAGVADSVKQILSETQDIMGLNRLLKDRLGETTQEIKDLREHLEEVRREAMTDALTGIANRKFLDLTLQAEAKMAAEAGDELCLLMMDIDHFKRFNDTYGHRVGDEVLKIVARTLKDNVKGQDLPARYGGEEFCAVLPKTSLADAVSVATNIRHALATRKLTNKRSGDSYGSVTISIGVAKYRNGEPIGELVKRADQALYLAKDDGRNRVATEPDTELAAKRAG